MQTLTPSQPDIAVRIPALHADQRQVIAQTRARRFALLRAGRRWGKSHLLTVIMARAAVRGCVVAYFAPTYKLMTPVWEAMQRCLPAPTFIARRAERRIDAPNGGRIECWSLDNQDAGRSRGYDLAVVDEAGLVPNLTLLWNANILPTLLDRNGRAVLAGTPKGKNAFWTLFQTALHDPERWTVIHRRTSDNPLLNPADVAMLRSAMTDRAARQELDAEFLDDGGAVFRNVRACIADAPRHADQPAVIGVDWGRFEDATVFVALDPQTGAVVALERLTDAAFDVQRRALRALWERTGCGPIIAEANSIGRPNIEELRREGLPVRAFTTTQATKAQIIDALALAFERQAIRIPAVDWLIGELEMFGVEALPSGAVRYGAPAGMHDDGVIALALAWSGMGRANSAVGAFL